MEFLGLQVGWTARRKKPSEFPALFRIVWTTSADQFQLTCPGFERQDLPPIHDVGLVYPLQTRGIAFGIPVFVCLGGEETIAIGQVDRGIVAVCLYHDNV